MNNIFKDIKIGDEVFSYYYQIWGRVIDCGTHEFAVSYILGGDSKVTKWYDYEGGRGWLSGHRTQEVFTEEIPPLPADDLSNLRVGDKVFVQLNQKWGEVIEVLPADAGIVILVPLTPTNHRRITTTNTGLYNETYKVPIIFLEEVPQPSEILTNKARFYQFL